MSGSISPSVVRFDARAEVPRLLAIDASAGTGKTFTLASLVTRLVGEGEVAAPDLLVVTFTRAATSELRSRVRAQLVEAAAHLRGVGSGAPSPVAEHLLDADAAERAARAARLEQAVVDFDLATVTTIHGFATQLLGSIGVTAGADLDAALVDDLDDLLPEVCTDVLAAAALAGHAAADLPKLDALMRRVRVRLSNPDMALFPADDLVDGLGADAVLLRDVLEDCLDQVARRRRRSGAISFDDVLVQLRDVLRGRVSDDIRATIADRFGPVLVDEFQDTDPVQWDVFSALFGSVDSGSRLVLVGDPKQAIYAFRGADVHTFGRAVNGAGVERRSLDRNWRSDGALLQALNALFEDVTFGTPDIAYSPVSAAEGHEDHRVVRSDGTPVPPLVLRLALGDDLPRKDRKPYELPAPDVRRAITADLVAQIRDLLTDAHLPLDDPPPDGPATRPVEPSDVAVLVRTRDEADEVQRELIAQGIPAVLARGRSVLESPAADHLRRLLEAVARPGDPTRARTYALTCFEDLTPERLDEIQLRAAGDAPELTEIQERLRSWADLLERSGVVAFFRRVWRDTGVAARVLGRADGDRLLTDLDHIVELLHVGAAGSPVGVAGLLDALASEPMAGPDAEAGLDPAARRVETDRQAVQIMTIWVSKGLEFPVVCCPTLWTVPKNSDVVFHDDETGLRTLDLSGKDWPDKRSAEARKARAQAEAQGENLRLAYVALTRARHHCIAWWTRCNNSANSAWAKILFARSAGRIDPELWAQPKVDLPADDATAEALRPLVERSGGMIAVEVHGRVERPPEPWQPSVHRRPGPSTPVALEVSELRRSLDRSAKRWSFTALASTVEVAEVAPTFVTADPFDPSEGDAGSGDEPSVVEEGEGGFEGADDALGVGPVVDEPAEITVEEVLAAPLAWLPGGTGFGTLVHSVFEDVDFTAPDLAAAFGDRFDEVAGWRPVSLRVDGVPAPAPAAALDGRDLLVDGLVRVTTTPLGPAFGDRALRDVAPVDRLDELSFDLRLPEGEGQLDVGAVSALIARHLLADDPLAAWAAGWAAETDAAVLAGHLTGSIDLVARVAGPDGGPRFLVVDYKTNRLHERGRSPRPGDYGRAALADAMAHSHYGLQAVLYSVALHRYLRWRLADYDPARHLGGAAYLFVRGMNGPDTPVVDGHPDGVFTWAVPSALVVELSDLLAGEVRS